MLISPVLLSCSQKPVEGKKTDSTVALIRKLNQIPSHGFMFGHHDDTVYGIGWEGDSDRSDVKSVCGDYPAVISFDLGRIEKRTGFNLDKISFEKIRKEIVKHHDRGGIISLSWHVDNPVTMGDSWDTSDSTVVKSVLPGGKKHDMFICWLDIVADYINSLKTKNGTKIPVIFRPWHEHTGSWFWWGQKLCTDNDYKELWRMTYDHMNKRNVNNVVYAYSPGSEPENTAEYLQRYPGDDIVDLIGFDTYQFERSDYIRNLEKSLSIVTQVGRFKNKPIAITETGYEAIPDSSWWTETLLPVIARYPVSYVLVWRNAREKEG